MGFILYIIIVGISLAMFVVKREQKLALLIFYSMCLSSVNTGAYIGASILTPSVCFLLSEVRRFGKYYTQLKSTTLFYPFVMMLAASFVVYCMSQNLQGAKGLFTIFKADFVIKYFAILYALFSLRNIMGFKMVVNTAFISILILTAFGMLNLITQHSIFVDWALEGATSLNSVTENAGAKFTDSTRFRVQAMHLNPFVYGYICMFSSILFIYAWKKGFMEKAKYTIALGCCLFGIITCATRSIMLCSFICYATYYVLTHKIAKKIPHIIVFFMLLYAFYLYIPFVHEKLQFIGTMFGGEADSEVRGSSIEMRLTQLAAVLYHVEGHFLFGRGYDFFRIDLGWEDGRDGLLDPDLEGLEGVQFSLLLERGVIGLLVYAIFWLSMLYLFYKYKKRDRQTCALGISIIIGYLLFSIMNGELGAPFFAGLILGMGMRIYSLNNDSIAKSSLTLSNTLNSQI